MNETIPAPSAPLPAERPDNPIPGTQGTKPEWSRPRRRGTADAACRLLGRLWGVRPYRDACWCVRCTLRHLKIYRRERVRYGRSGYVRTTLFGIRILPDRYAFPLD